LDKKGFIQNETLETVIKSDYWNNGIYLVKVQTGAINITQKIIK